MPNSKVFEEKKASEPVKNRSVTTCSLEVAKKVITGKN